LHFSFPFSGFIIAENNPITSLVFHQNLCYNIYGEKAGVVICVLGIFDCLSYTLISYQDKTAKRTAAKQQHSPEIPEASENHTLNRNSQMYWMRRGTLSYNCRLK